MSATSTSINKTSLSAAVGVPDAIKLLTVTDEDLDDYFAKATLLTEPANNAAKQTSCAASNAIPTASEIPSNNTPSKLGLGMPLMQSSPPPHIYRHTRVNRHLKNPPQPHMSIRTTTEAGEEIFINVLSWTRIVIPQEPSDPIPLYGGMRVPSGSPRSPPIVFAVMANPEVLKDSGRHCTDPEERRAIVELMCDFVEAMNPGIKLIRNAFILKDRDISGELKDVWNAVQAQRDREREDQLFQQRQQQQQYHINTSQQMFPKTTDNLRLSQRPTDEPTVNASFESESATLPLKRLECEMNMSEHTKTQINKEDCEDYLTNDNRAKSLLLNTSANEYICNDDSSNNIVDLKSENNTTALQQQHSTETETACYETNSVTAISSSLQSTTSDTDVALDHTPCNTTDVIQEIENVSSANINTNATGAVVNMLNTDDVTLAANPKALLPMNNMLTAQPQPQPQSQPQPQLQPPAQPTIKEKLGGFLPNGCIFPRFRINKHKDKDKEKDKEKDKDKEKEKEGKTKDKEKSLLSVLMKSKDKKVVPIQQAEKISNDISEKSNYHKNCINLENDVQKLDLNKIDINSSNDSIFIKLKLTANSTISK